MKYLLLFLCGTAVAGSIDVDARLRVLHKKTPRDLCVVGCDAEIEKIESDYVDANIASTASFEKFYEKMRKEQKRCEKKCEAL